MQSAMKETFWLGVGLALGVGVALMSPQTFWLGVGVGVGFRVRVRVRGSLNKSAMKETFCHSKYSHSKP